MIGYLAGTVQFHEEDAVCIVTSGVGYRVLMPLFDIARAQVGQRVEVFIHTHVREDAIVLFGFLSRDGLKLFERLLNCQGVGPKMALGLLSGMEPQALIQAIAEGDEARLTKIPGVGKKTAARIVLELRESFAKLGLGSGLVDRGAKGGLADDLRSALANLGYKTPQIDRAQQKVKDLIEAQKPLSDVVREALKHVG